MAEKKDPAVLFYCSDFLGGTMLMSYEERGRYITLLCVQRENGHLSESDMKSICGDNEKLWSKFVQDEDGKWYNERMDEEIQKRKAFSQKQSERAYKRFHGNATEQPSECHGNATAMPIYGNGNGNRNGNKNGNGNKFVKPTVEEVTEYCTERGNNIDPQSFIDFYESKGWKIGSQPMKDWKAAIRTWEQRRKEEAPRQKPVQKPKFEYGDKGKYGSFDAEEAFALAIARSYGEE